MKTEDSEFAIVPIKEIIKSKSLEGVGFLAAVRALTQNSEKDIEVSVLQDKIQILFGISTQDFYRLLGEYISIKFKTI